MTINNLKNKLDDSLKKRIKSEGYYASGKLFNSINFIVKEGPDGPSITLDALEYIQYIDNGKFIKGYFASNDFLDPIKEYLASYVSNTITSSLTS
jgi:hypothetical protein